MFFSHSAALLVRINWNRSLSTTWEAVLKIDPSYFGYKDHPIAAAININLRLKIEAKISLWVRRHFPYLQGAQLSV
jgi:hypothetical protein